MINYTANPDQLIGLYGLSYRELKDDYWKFRRMDYEEFKNNAADILHFACIVLWMKEASINVLSDTGVIHELVHLLIPATRDGVDIAKLKEDFIIVCELA